MRNPAELEESGYIEGAVNIPLLELAQHTDLLPADDTPIVVYCAAGTRATLAMGALAAMGYSDVNTMAGGSFGGWVEEGYPIAEGELPEAEVLNVAEIDPAVVAAVDAYLAGLPEGFAQLPAETLNEELIDGEELVLIDVRRPDELEENGVIEGAINIPLEQFVEMKDLWPAEDANIVVYCRAGYRGNFAVALLRTYGYENVRNLKGGFMAWEEAGLPIEGGMADAGETLDANISAFLANMEGYNFTTPAAVNEMLVENPDLFLLDVRGPAELEEGGYIEGAVNIPVRELAQHTDLLPALDTPIVVYCAAGTRATLGMDALAAMGYTDVKAMVGGSFGGWVNEGYPIVEGELPEAEVLDAVEIDPAVLAAVDAYLMALPEGFAQLPAETLTEEQVDGAELVLIDVRRPEEVEENGVIEGAVNIPLEQFIEMKDMWPAEDADIVVYCKAGARGNIATGLLRVYGYENVRNLKGGFDGWVEAGYPVVTE